MADYETENCLLIKGGGEGCEERAAGKEKLNRSIYALDIVHRVMRGRVSQHEMGFEDKHIL